MMRMLLTFLLVLIVAGSNALVVHSATIARIEAIAGDNDSKPSASMQWLDAQHPLVAAKDRDSRQPHSTRGEPHCQVVALPRSALRPFRLAIDWSLLAGRLAAVSLCWLEVRLQI